MNQDTHVGLARPRRDLTEATAPVSDCSESLLSESADCSVATLGCSALRSRLVSRAIAFAIDSFELPYIAFSFCLRCSQPSHAISLSSQILQIIWRIQPTPMFITERMYVIQVLSKLIHTRIRCTNQFI